jgi:hypothetical protein
MAPDVLARLQIALASVTIAIYALVISSFQVHAIRRHQRLSVIPWLGISFYYNEEGAGWVLDRSGTGPALLQTFEVFVDGIPQPHWLAAGYALSLPPPPNLEFTVPRSGTLLTPAIKAGSSGFVRALVLRHSNRGLIGS